jgi:hypothetical protein
MFWCRRTIEQQYASRSRRLRQEAAPARATVGATVAGTARRGAAAGAENGFFAGSFSAERETMVLLAMQKVEGSNPFSRFAKRLQIEGVSSPSVG